MVLPQHLVIVSCVCMCVFLHERCVCVCARHSDMRPPVTTRDRRPKSLVVLGTPLLSSNKPWLIFFPKVNIKSGGAKCLGEFCLQHTDLTKRKVIRSKPR